MIGQKLKLARKAAGLSLRQLQDKIGNRVTAQAIGKYERNESVPSSPVLIALAEALAVSVDYLLGDQDLSLDRVEFRKKSVIRRKEKARLEAKAIDRLERYLLIEELLGLQSIEWDRPLGAPYAITVPSEAETVAIRTREHWGLGMDPIPDLAELMEERGIKVLSLQFEDHVDGLTADVCRPDKPPLPIIMVNARHWGERQRFTLAHELGHILMQPLDDKNATERSAHRFAGAFLMPAEALWAEIGMHRTSFGMGELVQLKKLFRVSLQALTYRFLDLGIITRSVFKEMFEYFSQQNYRTPPYKEPGALPPDSEEPLRFQRLCFRALAEGAISEAKCAELLGISVRQLQQEMGESQSV